MLIGGSDGSVAMVEVAVVLEGGDGGGVVVVCWMREGDKKF